MKDLEMRFASGSSVDGRSLYGVAAPFGVQTRIADFSEVIAPGAFTATLASGVDILALADHDTTRVLGRTRTGSLELQETDTGLEYRLRMV